MSYLFGRTVLFLLGATAVFLAVMVVAFFYVVVFIGSLVVQLVLLLFGKGPAVRSRVPSRPVPQAKWSNRR